MRNFSIILAHTYKNRLLSKAFLISTAFTLLFMLIMINMDQIFMMFERDAEDRLTTVAVQDERGDYFEALSDQLEVHADQIELVNVEMSDDELLEVVSTGEYEAALIVTTNEEGVPQATYYSDSLTQQFTPMQLQSALQQVKESNAAEGLGLSNEELAEIYSPVVFETSTVSDSARSETELNQARSIVFVLIFIIYFSVLLYGNMIATEIATEKSSRVMEILVSSASPVAQMFGKIVGIGLLALTQYALILVVAITSSVVRSTDSANPLSQLQEMLGGDVALDLIGFAILFFILGYLLYATLAATLGSLVSRTEDVNQVVGPINLLVIVAFFIAMFGLNAPDSSFVTMASFIPFFSPMIMFLRIGVLNVPAWELALSIGILVASIAALAFIGAKIFKGGVLLYGKTSAFKSISKALQMSKKE
ncbi:ABC transporter permease [Bacillus sp. FJAT-45037]|uniref:ABC transporter permease n=1 Tax=Bacillus sp. FJAT-45037 TaxID=2011007 RepID=UPI000C233304|nr:ABC transporter permease [Bacillus sp. FJAT-45037]